MPETQNDQGNWKDLKTFAANPTTIIAAVVIGFGFSFAAVAGLLGLPLALVLFALFSSYLFVVLDEAARGRTEPPLMSIELVNIFRLRPMGVFAMLIAMTVLVGTAARASPAAGALTLVVTSLIVPALICIIVVADNPITALLPHGVARFLSALGMRYVVTIFQIVGLILVITLSSFVLPGIALSMISVYCLILIFRLLGHSMYLCRHELGISPVEAPEVSEARARRQQDRDYRNLLDEIHIQSQSARYEQALGTLTTFLGTQEDREDAEDWFLGRLLQWEKPRVAELLARDVVTRRVSRRDLRAALDICERTILVSDKFCPATAAESESLARHARQLGKRKLAYEILHRADREHGLSGSGHLLAARVASEDLADWAAAKSHARKVLQQYSDLVSPEEKTLCRTIIEISGN